MVSVSSVSISVKFHACLLPFRTEIFSTQKVLNRNSPQRNQQATLVDRDQDWLDGRASEWQRFLRWAHASYGWTEEVIVKRAGEVTS